MGTKAAGPPLPAANRQCVEYAEMQPSGIPQPKAAPSPAAPAAPAALDCSVEEIQQSVFAKIKAAWGAKEGNEAYNDEVDFNADGAINILDYQVFLKSLQTDFEAMKAGWGNAAGQEKYNAACDYNSDGKINILDYQKFIQKWVA